MTTVVTALSAPPLLAQSSASPDRRFGFGIAVSKPEDKGIPQFDVPIDVTGHFRVQPEFRYKRTHDVFVESESDPTSPGSNTSRSSMWLGTALLFTTERDRFGFYVGGTTGLARTTVNRHTVSDDGTFDVDVAANGYFVGPLIGGEYFLHERFSVGAAIGVVYQTIDFASSNKSLLRARASFTARVYLR